MKFRIWNNKLKKYEDFFIFYINFEGKLFQLTVENNRIISAPPEYQIEYGSVKYHVFENDRITWFLRNSIIEGYVKRIGEEFWVYDINGGNSTRLSKVRKLTVIGTIHDDVKEENKIDNTRT